MKRPRKDKVYFSILGSFAAWRGGEALQLGGAKRRALLAFLVVHANEFVAADTLIEHLWGDGRPDAATATLQSHISQLRKVLGQGCLHTEVGAYRLSLGPDELDATVFETELAEGQRRLREGDAAGAVEFLEAALGRWHGTPLAGVDGDLWASGLISRLVQLRAAAIETLLTAKLELGHHHHVIGLAEAAIAEHPVQEALWGQLMLSLYRSGRQAEALQTYQRLRETLVDELGLEPTPQLARLEQSILQHDPELEWTGRAAGPDDGATMAPAGRAPSAPVPVSSLPLPPRLAALSDQGFVGRVGERQCLSELLAQVTSGARRVALVAGEPGIGKTRLAALVAREAALLGATVLYGSCSEDLGAPYEPFLESLGPAVTHLPADVLAAQVEAHGDVLTRLIPEMGGRVSAAPPSAARDPESERYLLFRAVAGVLGALAGSHPVVLILDDLHWADKSTLLLLRSLLAVEPAPRLLIVGTYRHSDLSRHHPLTDVLAALRRDPSVERLALGGLVDTEVLELVERTFGGRLDDASTSLVHALGRETDGNPFFAGELLRHLAESGALRRDDDGRLVFEGFISAQGFPDSIREVISRRIDRLGDSTSRALTAASVIGRDFDLQLLAGVLDTDEDDLLDLLEQATSANLLTSDRTDQFSFTHALAEHALYEGLSLSRRSRLHRRVAESLQDRSAADGVGRSAELAYHWSRTDEVATAIVHARAAGHEALAQLGPDQAVRWFEQALELLRSKSEPDELLRSDLLTDLGEAQRQAGDADYRQTLLDAAHLARSLGATPVLVRSALANHRGDSASSGQVDHERVAVLEGALATLDQADSPSHALLLAIFASELQWAPDWQRRLAGERRRAGHGPAAGSDRPRLATVLSARHEAIRIPPTLAERLDNTAELLAISRTVSATPASSATPPCGGPIRPGRTATSPRWTAAWPSWSPRGAHGPGRRTWTGTWRPTAPTGPLSTAGSRTPNSWPTRPTGSRWTAANPMRSTSSPPSCTTSSPARAACMRSSRSWPKPPPCRRIAGAQLQRGPEPGSRTVKSDDSAPAPRAGGATGFDRRPLQQTLAYRSGRPVVGLRPPRAAGAGGGALRPAGPVERPGHLLGIGGHRFGRPPGGGASRPARPLAAGRRVLRRGRGQQ